MGLFGWLKVRTCVLLEAGTSASTMSIHARVEPQSLRSRPLFDRVHHLPAQREDLVGVAIGD